MEQLFDIPTDKDLAREKLNPFLSKLNPEITYSPKEVAEMCFVSESTIIRRIESGELKALAKNPKGKTKRYVIYHEDMERFVKEWFQKNGVPDDKLEGGK